MINAKISYIVPGLKEIIISLVGNNKTGKKKKSISTKRFKQAVQSNEKAY